MKAVIITNHGKAEVLKLEEREIPTIDKNEVLIKVKAAGVNRPDVMQREGKYPAPPGAPKDIPGLEVAGIIEKVGTDVKQWKVGDQVCALVAGGGYAEFVNADAGSCLPVPKGFTFVQAAGLPETVFTVWSNVFQRGKLQGGESILIHGGSSGIGITAIQLAKHFGANVTVTVGSDEKGQYCLDLGADKFINYKTQDFEKELSEQKVDVVLDMIGGDYFDKNLNILRPEGRLVHINAMKGNHVSLNLTKVMQKRITITGSTLRTRELSFKTSLAADIHKKVWPVMESGNFKPVIFATFPLKDAYKAHELMESSQHIGKIILEVESSN
ncbi:NAD(P)H-quinone oxidoreductase [Pedobacter immunditicola]|uniref:NAD(P)H-quinone oxidoreductase n=1 Tax=Pedobacter immunditicola TaxID=3133440 RepID=UPI0030A0A3F0